VAGVAVEAAPGRRDHAVDRPEVRAGGADPGGDQVALGHELVHAHLQVGELRHQPLDGLAHVVRTVHEPRHRAREGRGGVLDEVVGEQHVAGRKVPLVEGLLEVAPDQGLVRLEGRDAFHAAIVGPCHQMVAPADGAPHLVRVHGDRTLC
jgi:hypothetical protein